MVGHESRERSNWEDSTTNFAFWNICECLTKLKQVERVAEQNFMRAESFLLVIKRTAIGILKCILREEADHKRSDVELCSGRMEIGRLADKTLKGASISIHLVPVDPGVVK